MNWSSVLVVAGLILQCVAWRYHRRDDPTFWVSRPIWYWLTPTNSVLAVVGIWLVLGGGMLYGDVLRGE